MRIRVVAVAAVAALILAGCTGTKSSPTGPAASEQCGALVAPRKTTARTTEDEKKIDARVRLMANFGRLSCHKKLSKLHPGDSSDYGLKPEGRQGISPSNCVVTGSKLGTERLAKGVKYCFPSLEQAGGPIFAGMIAQPNGTYEDAKPVFFIMQDPEDLDFYWVYGPDSPGRPVYDASDIVVHITSDPSSSSFVLGAYILTNNGRWTNFGPNQSVNKDVLADYANDFTAFLHPDRVRSKMKG
jgi:hypothetical protein